MPRIEITAESDLAPERILAAATDFTERRPDIWPNISRKYYKVHSQGENWAEVTEGTDVMGGVWARERYEWSGDTVTGTAGESNVFQPGGTWQMRVQPSGNGSRITIVNDRKPKGPKGKTAALMMSVVGKKVLSSHLQKTLEIIAKDEA
jgi:hypothetical protein